MDSGERGGGDPLCDASGVLSHRPEIYARARKTARESCRDHVVPFVLIFNSVGNGRKVLRIKMATDMGLKTKMQRFWNREYLIVSKPGAEL